MITCGVYEGVFKAVHVPIKPSVLNETTPMIVLRLSELPVVAENLDILVSLLQHVLVESPVTGILVGIMLRNAGNVTAFVAFRQPRDLSVLLSRHRTWFHAIGLGASRPLK